MFSPELTLDARDILDLCRKQGLKLATAESCTGGLITALLTSIAGSSDVVERGFVTYSKEAKTEMLGVAAAKIDANGAVSEIVARAMAEGALAASRAKVLQDRVADRGKSLWGLCILPARRWVCPRCISGMNLVIWDATTFAGARFMQPWRLCVSRLLARACWVKITLG